MNRSSWAVGALMLWMATAVLCSIAEEQNIMFAPAGADGTTPLTTLQLVLRFPDILNLIPWLGAVVRVITLWFDGTMWQGNWIWAYYLIIAPITVGLVVEIWSFAASFLTVILAGLKGVFGAIGSIFGLGR